MVASFKVFLKPLGRAIWPNQETFIRLNCCGNVRGKTETFVRCFSKSKDNIVTSKYRAPEIPNVPFHECVFERMGKWENKIALECVASGKKWTYRDLYRCTKNLASSLQKKFKMKKGDCQCILLPNCPEYPGIILAGSRIGVVTTTMNPLYTATEISIQLKVTEPKIIYTTPEAHEKCVEALKILNVDVPIVTVNINPQSSTPEGAVSFSELSESSTPKDYDPATINPLDNLVIPFSSGTGGLPKGVELCHKNLVSNVVQVDAESFLKDHPDKETNQNVIMAVLPMFHIYGMTVVTFDGLRGGGRLLCMPNFEPKLFIQAIYTKKTDILYLVPPLIFFLANQPAVETKHLKSVYHVVNGAAPLGPSDITALLKKSSTLKVSQGYGMTEASPVVTMTSKERIHKVGSVGYPVTLTSVKVCDIETGKALPPGKEGEILVNGPQVMKGYYKQPEITKNSFDSDGWLKTGDIGYYDTDHDFFVVDRMKELIKVKGYQVAPAELEEVLRSHPQIVDAGVVGVPHPEQGEAPRAFVVVKQGSSLTEDEVMEFIKKELTPYKQLKGGVRFVKAIPKSSAGKILRKELKKFE